MEEGKFNTSQSKLWTKLQRVFKDELLAMYSSMRQNQFRYDNILNCLYGDQISKISERLYNLDAQQKYLQFGKTYLHMAHGNRLEHMKRWIRERLVYLDSLFGYEEDIKESITIRINKLGVAYLDISTYCPQYVKVVWRNGVEQVKKIPRNTTVRFEDNIPTATDQEVLVYNAKYLKDIGDLTNLNPKSIDIANATRITNLVCSSDNLLRVDVSKNTFLREVNLKNCSLLGTGGGGAQILDISKCSNLRKINLYGTSITSVSTNYDGGNLEEIIYPNTIQTITLMNQPNLTNIGIPATDYTDFTWIESNATALADFTLINCPNVVNITRKGSKEYYNDESNAKFIGLQYVQEITIINSMQNVEHFNLVKSSGLTKFIIQDCNFKEITLTGNKNDLSYSTNQIGNFNFNNCNNLEKINILNNTSYLDFVENTELDFSYIKSLKSFICSASLNNVNKILLPDSIKDLIFNGNIGSTVKDIWLKSNNTHTSDNFTGLDCLNMNLNDLCIKGLTSIENAININITPQYYSLSPNALRTVDNYIQPVGTMDYSYYKGSSLDYAFAGLDLNNSNFEITLPRNNNSVETINYGFYNTKVNNRINDINTLLSTLTNIKYAASLFENCDDLISVTTIPSKLVTMDRFYCNCTALISSPDMPNTVTTAKYAYYNCINLENAPTVSNSLIYGQSLFNGCVKIPKAPTLYEGLINCDSMYNNCTALVTASNIPSTVTNCFSMYSNTGITVAPTIPNGVTVCTNMFNSTNITIMPDIPNTVTTCQSMFKFTKIKETKEIPSSVTNGSEMFANCYELVTVRNLPSSMKNHNSIFSGCTKLESILSMDLEKSTAAWGAFYNCKSLANITAVSINNSYNLSLDFSITILTVASLVSILNALKDNSGNTESIPLVLGSKNLAKLSSDQILIATRKNWSLS